MKCPYCGSEMERGYLRSSHGFVWGKEKELGIQKNTIKLAGPFLKGMFKGFYAKAQHCVVCKKLIVDLEDLDN